MAPAAPHSGPSGTSGGTSSGGPGAGGQRVFRERLWPSAPTWLLVPLAGAFGAATGYVGGPVWAAAGGVVLAAVVLVVLVSASTVVSLTQEGALRVARASIGVEHLTGAVAARGEEAQGLRGPFLDGRSHLWVRGWVDPVVAVALGDPDDPTPSWVFSTRRPEELVAALAAHGVSGPVPVHRPASSASDEAAALARATVTRAAPLGAPDSTTPHPELGSERGAEGR